jgi:hypothetical protein
MTRWGRIKHHGGVDREVLAGIAVLPLQGFYTATAAYMRAVDPASLNDGLEHAMGAERVRLEALLGPSRQRRVLDSSCGGGTGHSACGARLAGYRDGCHPGQPGCGQGYGRAPQRGGGLAPCAKH